MALPRLRLDINDPGRDHCLVAVDLGVLRMHLILETICMLLAYQHGLLPVIWRSSLARKESLVTDPRTKESRGFGFVTMETSDDAERCVKYLNRTVLEGRLITVEKAKRSRGRTPTPGRYQGRRLRDRRGGAGRRRSHSYSPRRRYDRGHYDRDPYPRDRRGRSRSPYARRPDVYPDTYRRRRERSLSAGRGGYP